VLDLVKTGRANIRALHVESPTAVRDKELDVSGRKIDVGSWIAMASLRASENSPLYKSIARMGDRSSWDPRSWHAGLKGMTSIPEIKRWFTRSGFTVAESTDNTLRAYKGYSAVNAARLLALGKRFGEYEVILLVNSGQVKADNPSQRPRESGGDHYVRLASSVDERDGYLFFRVWTWGEVKNLKVKKDDVGRVVYGYVVAEPPDDAVVSRQPAAAAPSGEPAAAAG